MSSPRTVLPIVTSSVMPGFCGRQLLELVLQAARRTVGPEHGVAVCRHIRTSPARPTVRAGHHHAPPTGSLRRSPKSASSQSSLAGTRRSPAAGPLFAPSAGRGSLAGARFTSLRQVRVSSPPVAVVIVASRRGAGRRLDHHVDAEDLQGEARRRRVGVTGTQGHEPSADGGVVGRAPAAVPRDQERHGPAHPPADETPRAMTAPTRPAAGASSRTGRRRPSRRRRAGRRRRSRCRRIRRRTRPAAARRRGPRGRAGWAGRRPAPDRGRSPRGMSAGRGTAMRCASLPRGARRRTPAPRRSAPPRRGTRRRGRAQRGRGGRSNFPRRATYRPTSVGIRRPRRMCRPERES